MLSFKEQMILGGLSSVAIHILNVFLCSAIRANYTNLNLFFL